MCDTIQSIRDLAQLTDSILRDESFTSTIDDVAARIVEAYKNGKKTIFCGNGGSSAEAQHLAAELSGKFRIDRKPIPAEACHVNASFVTAVANDYDFTRVYARHIEAFGERGDVLIGLSTSGTSLNILNAFEVAREKELLTVALTGETGGDLNELSDLILKVPSHDVARIQEIHLLIGHILCDKVESELFGNEQ